MFAFVCPRASIDVTLRVLPVESTEGGFTELISAVISALGYLPLWGNSKFEFRVMGLPGVTVKPLFGPNLDSTFCYR